VHEPERIAREFGVTVLKYDTARRERGDGETVPRSENLLVARRT